MQISASTASTMTTSTANNGLSEEQLMLRALRRKFTNRDVAPLTPGMLQNMQNTHALANRRANADGNLLEIRQNPFGRRLTEDGRWQAFSSHQERQEWLATSERQELEALLQLATSTGLNLNTLI